MNFQPARAFLPERRLPHVPWMDIPGVRAIVWALGREQVRFVGGCVRDYLCGRQTMDVDIATVHRPTATLERLKEARVRAKAIGIEHGTVVAITDSGQFEITTLRRDVETDGRHAKVAFTNDWAEDAARRDFTFNALSINPDGDLFDPACGIDDLHAGRVRFLGSPAERMREDVLRILRFFRFGAWYGRIDPDPAALAACAAAAGHLERLSGERISAELRRLLAAPNPYRAAQAMADYAILRRITALRPAPRTLSRLIALEQVHDREPSPLCRLAVLLPGSAEDYAALAERLRFSKSESRRLAALARPLPELGDDPASVRRALYRSRDRDVFALQALVAAAEGDQADLRLRLSEAASWAWPKLPVSGLDLIELGVPPGPNVGAILSLLEEWWTRHNFAPDREACLAAMQRAFNRSTPAESRDNVRP